VASLLRDRTSAFVILLIVTIVCLSNWSFFPNRATQTQTQAPAIKQGQSQGGDLRGLDFHLFKIKATAGQFVRVTVLKNDFHLSASVLSSELQARTKYIGRRYGPLSFSFVVDFQGPVYLRLQSLDTEGEARHYELRIDEVRSATPTDVHAAAASRVYAEADALRFNWDQQSLRSAIAKYSEALPALKLAGDPEGQVRAFRSIGECYFILSEYRSALDVYMKALALSESLKTKQAGLEVQNDVGFVYVYLSDNQQALRYSHQVLSSLARQSPDAGMEMQLIRAQALNNAGEAFYSLSDLRKALDYFTQALAAWRAGEDRSGQALAHLNLGYTYADLGDSQKASEHYRAALELWKKVGHAQGEALCLTALGGLESFRGEKQSALTYHHEAVRAFQTMGNAQGEAAAWNGIGQAYEDLNQHSAALDSYGAAFQLFEQIENKDFAGLSRYYMGRVYQALGDSESALKNYAYAVKLSEAVGDKTIQAHALKGIGHVYESQGKTVEAFTQYFAALKRYKLIGDRRWQARTLNSIGHLHAATGNMSQALTNHKHALELSRAVEDRREQVSALYNIALAESELGNIEEALLNISPALELIEFLRLRVAGEQLRTSYFASVQEHYQLCIDLLMRADKKHPGKGFAAQALQISERARSRLLLETLSVARVEPATWRSQELLSRERSISQELNLKLESRTRLLNKPDNKNDPINSQEIRQLMNEYEEVLRRIKEETPIYAGFTQARTLRAEDIQQQIGEDTILLEYALGKKRSYLWAVTSTSISGYELPPQAAIEAAASEVYRLLIARQPVPDEKFGEYWRRVENADINYWASAAKLSRMLLGPVASSLNYNRFLIVGDGILHRIPFDALSEPAGRDDEPILWRHEVVTIPSASVLSALQGAGTAQTVAPKLIAVLADPVFDGDDPRVQKTGDLPAESTQPEDTSLYQALAELNESEIKKSLPRLSSTLQEVRVINDLTTRGDRFVSTGFSARRETVIDGDFSQFRIIHFAAHGLFNDEHPDLSGLVLSRVDESGRRIDGFLRAADIYRLRLNADLVVLSACRTGLGRSVSGEGLLGVTRGFLYAGSRSVLASLWKVNDEATSELMQYFYSAMLKDGLSPSAALRVAKNRMYQQERWRSPYYWAAFVIQGKYNHSPVTAASVHKTGPPWVVLSFITLALVAGSVFWLICRRRTVVRLKGGSIGVEKPRDSSTHSIPQSHNK
jgi:CHAT domain-containing protein